MSGFLFDTNVLLDIATADPVWLAWSENQFRTAAAQGPIVINPIKNGSNRRLGLELCASWVVHRIREMLKS